MEEVEAKENVGCKPDRKKIIGKMRENPWMLSTIVLGVLFLGFLFGGIGFNGSVTGAVSADVAADNFQKFADAKGIALTINSVSEKDGLYLVSFSTEEGDSYVYVSKDGKNLVSGLVSLELSSSGSQATEVPKSNKPEIELFIWGYCPYGVQAQGPLAEVAKLLSDYADFKTVLYYDGHGAFETEQNKIQECIQEIAPDKYWDYAEGFVEDIYPVCSISRDVECDKSESTKLMNSLGIDSEEVFACVEEKGESLLGEASARARELGVTGSPTLVVNGVKVNVARNSEAFKTAVCNAFNDAPEICGETLDSTEAAAAGNC